jgi:hypothetical protein
VGRDRGEEVGGGRTYVEDDHVDAGEAVGVASDAGAEVSLGPAVLHQTRRVDAPVGAAARVGQLRGLRVGPRRAQRH